MTDLKERLTGTLADRYVIERELGRGGMATVYLARDVKHNREVAVKVLHPELTVTLGHERFLREIEIVARLTHPRILTLIDSGDADGFLYYVMPYVEGETLKDRLGREGALPVDEALRIAREVADALSYAHEKGVIHRDIKPSNILFGAGHAVIADFGVARAVGVAGGEDTTATGLAVGTPKYMSPEQAAGSDVDGRADLYALGCVLWEMLAGEAPFEGPTPQAILALKSSDSTPSLRVRRSHVPPGVEGVIEKAMAAQPADRYATAADLEQALAAPEAAEKWKPRRRARARGRILVVAAASAVAILAGAWWITRSVPEVGAAEFVSMAVLPIENLTGDPAQDYFVAGMQDALIGQLGKLSGFRVISRSSVRRYADSDQSIPEIAGELGVEYLVEASATRDGEGVHVEVHLIEAMPEERQVWMEGYDGDVEHVMEIHGQVARGIAGALDVEVSPDDEVQLAGTRPVNPETYESYLRGMYFINEGTPEGIAAGLAHLHEATERDPGDAMAWAGLATGYALVGHGPAAPPDAWIRARAAAERAVGLDSMLAEGHAAMADVKLYYDWDWAGAEESFLKADELNPNLAMNQFHYAWYLLLVGRWDEALEIHELGQDLDPLTSEMSAILGWAYLYPGRTDKAIEEARKALALKPDGMFGLATLGAAFSAEGRYDEAIATHERMAELYPVWRWLLGRTYAKAGRMEDARQLAAQLESEEQSSMSAFGLAVLYAALGANDASFRWLEYEPPHAWVAWGAVDPVLELPRDDPRFQDFLRKLNLPNFPS
jgi:serine/threonine-protein kinase